MGVSTNAIIFYGYCWSDDQEGELFEGSGDWEELILRRRGETSPWDSYPAEDRSLPYDQRRAIGDQWVQDHRAELDAWREKKEAVIAEFDVVLGDHCSGDHPIPYLAADNVVARRGCPEPVLSLNVGQDWDAKLDRWLAEFGIAKPHEKPQWWLVSYYG